MSLYGGRGGTRGTVAFGKAPQNFYTGLVMGGVCASPCAHQFGSVQYMRRSFASGWAGPSAFYGERLRDFVYYVVVEYRWGGVWLAKFRDPPSIGCRCGHSGGERWMSSALYGERLLDIVYYGVVGYHLKCSFPFGSTEKNLKKYRNRYAQRHCVWAVL